MLDKWFRNLRLRISVAEFHELPRNPAFKYEYLNNHALLTPRPLRFHAVLQLAQCAPAAPLQLPEPVRIRPLTEADWEPMPALFAGAFSRTQPFATLDDDDCLQAARDCLEQTRTGGDGPLIAAASFMAVAAGSQQLLGGILITMIPLADLNGEWDAAWKIAPPADAVPRRLGRPHLTWVFVGPGLHSRGLGSYLLERSVNALLDLGFTDLASTFLLGNDGSAMWHWRNGFRLLPFEDSRRNRSLANS